MPRTRQTVATVRMTVPLQRANAAWFQRANNAAFGIQAAYNAWVPAFEQLFEREGRDMTRFYGAVRRLADLPRAERDATLAALGATQTAHAAPAGE